MTHVYCVYLTRGNQTTLNTHCQCGGCHISCVFHGFVFDHLTTIFVLKTFTWHDKMTHVIFFTRGNQTTLNTGTGSVVGVSSHVYLTWFQIWPFYMESEFDRHRIEPTYVLHDTHWTWDTCNYDTRFGCKPSWGISVMFFCLIVRRALTGHWSVYH